MMEMKKKKKKRKKKSRKFGRECFRLGHKLLTTPPAQTTHDIARYPIAADTVAKEEKAET